MEISPRKSSKRAQEPVDEWLQNEGYFRKHAPRDPTCLFRAVSEQIYLTQYYHIRVRKECVEFMRKMKHLFIENITIPFEDYLEQMACFTEWGGMNEIQAMSLLYKREFIIFNGQKQLHRTTTNNGFEDAIYICYTPQKQYETIYTRDFVATAAYCQSIVYQILYTDVFQMTNIESTVYKMLHDRTGTLRHDKFFLKGNLEIRDRLTAEIFTKVENGNDEVDNTQIVVKNAPPFPYRIAKALDPSIYRNTDFDIWHEIRREIKNAGWTRHNSHELQVGGKCLVQMNFNEEEFDKANNNSVYVSSLEKDTNDNDAKLLQKRGKQDPTFFYGHIQEMSKNQGPVLVFIEELGEKKIVPYSALKPLPLKKSKQDNWLPVCKRNVLVDSTQKWKKAYGPSSRKLKQAHANMNILLNNTDKHGNNENSVNNVNKNNFPWKEESLKMGQQQTYENYTLKKYPNYSVNNSSTVFATRMMFNNTQSSTMDNVMQENSKKCKEKSSITKKNSENNVIKNSKCDNVINMDNNAELSSYSKQKIQKETYYSSYTGDTASTAQMDMLRSVNCTVQKSVDINGSDLPLSDPFTLRFFYNLGLEYFHGNEDCNYLTNGQSSGFRQWCQGIPQNEEEIVNVANGVTQNCTSRQQKSEYNDCKEIDQSNQLLCQEDNEKCASDVRAAQIQKVEISKGEDEKNMMYSQREKLKQQEPVNKDSIRTSRNGSGSRFKKNIDNWHRIAQQPSQPSNSYCGSSPKSSKSQETKSNNISFQHSRSLPQQVHTFTDVMNPYQTSYMQQGAYSGLPYYANETEAFVNSYYPQSPGFFPVPCLPHSDIPDNNNIQPLSPHLFPGLDYAQAYSGLCPPFICPQLSPYSIPPQNIQEHWYAVAGQPHYMQYAPVLPIDAETSCNGIMQNVNQNTSS